VQRARHALCEGAWSAHHLAILEPAFVAAGQPQLCQGLCILLTLSSTISVQALNQHGLKRRPSITAIPLIARAFHIGGGDPAILYQT